MCTDQIFIEIFVVVNFEKGVRCYLCVWLFAALYTRYWPPCNYYHFMGVGLIYDFQGTGRSGPHIVYWVFI